MRFIIDTHVWLWWNKEPERLNAEARAWIEDAENQACLSVASVWELAIKFPLGKLKLPQPPRQYVLSRVARDKIFLLDILAVHALECAEMPPHHKDPFDRLIIAQARVEKIPVLTADPLFSKYSVKVLMAV